jgi:hypothetical protein
VAWDSLKKYYMTKIILIILFQITGTILLGQSLKNFTYSDCLTDCYGDSSEIKKIARSDRVIRIELRTYAPCSGNFKGEIKLLSSGVLDLRFRLTGQVYKDKNGYEYELIEVAECDCVFDFTYEIENLNDINKSLITVNGKTLKEIKFKYIPSDIKFDLDSLK